MTTLHHHYDPARLERVIDEMRRRGAPVLRGHLDAHTGVWMAAEGTHRLRAAAALGLTPQMVHVPWRRGRQALERARHAAARRGIFYPEIMT